MAPVIDDWSEPTRTFTLDHSENLEPLDSRKDLESKDYIVTVTATSDKLSNTVDFTLKINSPCIGPGKITPTIALCDECLLAELSLLPNAQFTDKVYNLGDPTVTMTWIQAPNSNLIKSSIAGCGPFLVDFINTDTGLSYNDQIFSQTTSDAEDSENSFLLPETTNSDFAGSYPFAIAASLKDYPSVVLEPTAEPVFTIDIVDPCSGVKLTPPAVLQSNY